MVHRLFLQTRHLAYLTRCKYQDCTGRTIGWGDDSSAELLCTRVDVRKFLGLIQGRKHGKVTIRGVTSMQIW